MWFRLMCDPWMTIKNSMTLSLEALVLNAKRLTQFVLFIFFFKIFNLVEKGWIFKELLLWKTCLSVIQSNTKKLIYAYNLYHLDYSTHAWDASYDAVSYKNLWCLKGSRRAGYQKKKWSKTRKIFVHKLHSICYQKI